MNGSVAVVTGASQGIGQATAVRLARDFSGLVLVARNRSNLDNTAAQVASAGAAAGRRQSYLEHWAPLHGMTVAEATEKFPREAGIARYGTPEEIAELMAFLVSPGAKWMTGSTLRMDGGEVKSI